LTAAAGACTLQPMPRPSEPLVVSVQNQFAEVLVDGRQRPATIAGRLRHARPVVGDRVELRETADGSLRIERVCERRGTLTRVGFRGRQQVVAANVDVLVIVAAAADPPLRANLIDRYLVAAWRGRTDAALALTKTDLPHDEPEVARVRTLLAGLGHAVVEVCVPLHLGVERLREVVGARTAVLAGHSGVGKTTLTNALSGRRDAVGEVNATIGRGRQTTTMARWIPLDGGGALIDTAGVRSFGIAGIPPEELQRAFPEIAAAAEGCAWQPCLHAGGEQGCAVPAAVSAQRLESYRRLLAELAEAPALGS
jgi:ribosome biogenesis GTPase